ncbi:MAG TPA: hypothetical protein VKO86_05720 [Gemmatimonadales bacterium]|nr:hypothetical protein [Gemmatimonadales bacterium]
MNSQLTPRGAVSASTRAVACAAVVLATVASLTACTVDRSRSPVCGMALLVGPNLIIQQLGDARALLTDAPRGLPGSLPVRVTGQPDTGRASVTAGNRGGLLLEIDGNLIPTISVDTTGRDSTVFGVLVVDDSTAIVHGVLIYERPRPPADYPRVGTLTDARRAVPLYGLRVNWRDLSNPRCPLFGDATQ